MKSRWRTMVLIAALIAMPLIVLSQGPTEPVLTGEALLDEVGPMLMSMLLEARTLPEKVKAAGAVGGTGIMMLFVVGLLRTKQLKGWLWDKVGSEWRVIIILCVGQIGGILMNIHGNEVLWYNALLDGLFLGGEALFTKQILWNAILKKGQVAKLTQLLSLLRLR